jgi:glycosyltransferase involved in cell wall biosynthesis
MKIGYLVNQYPKVSHSFVRREILALQALGETIERFALRGWDAEVVDVEDVAERAQTTYVLAGGGASLLIAGLQALLTSPWRFLAALSLSGRIARRSNRSMLRHWITLAEAAWLKRQLAARRVGHLHAHFGTNAAEVAMLCHALGGPGYSFTVHGPEEFDLPTALHLREKVERAAFVVAISSFCQSQLYRWVAHAYWPKIRVVRCGLEKSFHDVPAVPVPDAPRLVCVGRLSEQKGQLLLVNAAKQLKERGISFQLVLAGDGEMRGAIESLVEAYDLGEQVRITGWISSAQVRDELLAARAMVLPSFAEGLPVVIMEALALRRPVLTTYVAGIPELVEPGRCGWLFPAGSVQALADAMADCLAADLPRLQAMGEIGRALALAHHDIDIEAGKLATHFHGVAA